MEVVFKKIINIVDVSEKDTTKQWRDSNNQSLSQVVTFANPKIDSWRINLRKYLKSAWAVLIIPIEKINLV